MKTYEPSKTAVPTKPSTMPSGFTIKVFEAPSTTQSVKIKEYLPATPLIEDTPPVNKLYMEEPS
jgi:hypothetical protein